MWDNNKKTFKYISYMGEYEDLYIFPTRLKTILNIKF